MAAFALFDRVKETASTTGTGNFTLAGAVTAYQAFSAVYSTNDTFWYVIEHQSANEWEQGIGTYSAANTLTRTTVLKSSNANAAVNFSAGTKNVWVDIPASFHTGTALVAAASQKLDITGHAASSWTTDSGAVTIDGSGGLNLETTSNSALTIGGVVAAATIAGAAITITSARGGAASGGTAAGAAGTLTIQTGNGGAATTTAGGVSTVGGTLAIQGGTGGAGAATTNGANAGGPVTVTGGTGGASAGTNAGASGGTVTVQGGPGGAGSGSQNPGGGSTLILAGGDAGSGGTGNASGGDITVNGGTGLGTGVRGTVNIGNNSGSTTINVGQTSTTLCTTTFKGSVIGTRTRGCVDGFQMSCTSATTTLTITAGECDDLTHVVLIKSAITSKVFANTWAAGSGSNGLDTGTVANSTWYHVWAIRKDSDATGDILFSTSATAPTMPAGYTYKRRIGAFFSTSGGNVTQFIQVGDEFLWLAVPTDGTASFTSGTAQLATLSVPLGVQVWSLFNLRANAVNGQIYVSSPDQNDETVLVGTAQIRGTMFAVTTATGVLGWLKVRTNTSSQVRIVTNASYTLAWSAVGWCDPRGRDG